MNNLLNFKDVCEKTHFSRSTIFRKIKEGNFPPPSKINGRNLWADDEIELMIKSYLSGMSEKGIKKTIQEILNRRRFYREIYDEK